MVEEEPSPDKLAAKTFLVTILGAIVYIAVVFVFVISGNDEIAREGGPPAAKAHGP